MLFIVLNNIWVGHRNVHMVGCLDNVLERARGSWEDEAYFMQNLDKIITREVSVMVHFETFQVLDCSLILAIERTRANVCPDTRLLACRTLELCMDSEIGWWAFCCREGQSGQSFEY